VIDRRVDPRAARRVRACHSEDGQGLVEFSMVVPVFMLILLGMLEFGFLFNHNLTLQYATREGARAGAAMADGSQKDTTCSGAQISAANVDPLVVAAVQRVLTSPGSMIDMTQVPRITIYEVSNAGTVTGRQNVWTRTPGAGPAVPCQTGAPPLDYSPPVSPGWNASTRTPTSTPPSIGVAITYTYNFRTPLSGILQIIGGGGITRVTMTDRTVMAIEPTS